MKLPTCWNCDFQFKWSELLFILGWKKRCPNCQEMQYVTSDSIKMTSYLLIYDLIAIVFIWILPIDFWLQLLILIAMLLMTIIPIPYLIRFTNRKQPLF
ncbi:TIGR04104 family putative zinc finger protein [Piscibacillus salipiscarius]|uniref:TIGR04104 family putative zinc finger protein n=1 Tax=Piscibacillus salipiscarius TaxID=299480 RepID=A0ABW5QA84_9BACI